MHFDGSQYQNEIYITGESPWPVGADEWEARATEQLDSGPFGYIAGGAGSEATVRANREAFERRRLRPRMLVGNSVRDLSVDVLGTPSPFPFFLAPVGVLSIAHSDGELAPARAAAALRVPFILSSAASPRFPRRRRCSQTGRGRASPTRAPPSRRRQRAKATRP